MSVCETKTNRKKDGEDKMKKRFLRMIALLLTIALLLSGCAGSNVPSSSQAGEGDQSQPPAPTSSQPEEPAEPEEPEEAAAPQSTERVDLEAPYNGDFIIAVNTSELVEDLQDVGRIPLSDGDFSAFENRKQTEGNLIEGYSGAGAGENTTPSVYAVGDTMEISTEDYYQSVVLGNTEIITYPIEIELIYEGEFCTVWGQTSDTGDFPCPARLDIETAQRIAEEFDNGIYPFMTESFGRHFDADQDGKLGIVCLNLIDYYDYGEFDSYYYNGYSTADSGLDSVNGGDGTNFDMVAIDIWPTLYDMEGNTTEENWNLAMVTLVHEFQHSINFADYYYSPNQAEPMEIWLNEGFSTISENMYTGKPMADFVDFYVRDPDYKITNGRSPMQYDGSFEDYALCYYFCLYLLEQTKEYEGGGKEIFKSILESDGYDYRAIENALEEIGYPVTDFSDFLFNFRVALVANEDSGFFSFNKNEAVQNIPIHLYTMEHRDAPDGWGLREKFLKTLAGGAALNFTAPEDFVPVGNGPDVRFAGITLEE